MRLRNTTLRRRHAAGDFERRIGPFVAPSSGHRFATGVNASEEVTHYRLWNYVAITAIANMMAKFFPNVATVDEVPDQGPERTAALARRNSPTSKKARRHAVAEYQSVLGVTDSDALTPVSPTHPLITLFRVVNPIEWWSVFLFETIVLRRLTGAAYWWLIPNGVGTPTELWNIPPQWVDPPDGVRDKNTGVRTHWRIIPDGDHGRRINLPADEVVCWKEFNPRAKQLPMSPLRGGAEWVDNMELMEESRRTFWDNGPFPSTSIEMRTDADQNAIKTFLQEQLFEQIAEKFMERYATVKRSGYPIVVPPGFAIKPWSLKPNEMEFPESTDQLRDMVLSLHGVPKTIVGISTEVNRATAFAAMDQFCRFTIAPMLVQLAGFLTEMVAPRFGSNLRVWFDDCVPRDDELMLKQLSLLYGQGGLWPNEAREALGYEEVDDPAYNTGYLPLNLIPITEAGRPEPAPAPTSPGGDDNDDEDDSTDDGNGDAERRSDSVGISLPQRQRLWLPASARDGNGGGNGNGGVVVTHVDLPAGEAETILTESQSVATVSRPSLTKPFVLTGVQQKNARKRGTVRRLFLRTHKALERRLRTSVGRFWTQFTEDVLKRFDGGARSKTDLVPAREFKANFNAMMQPHWEQQIFAGVELEAGALGVDLEEQGPDDVPSIFVDLPKKMRKEIDAFLKTRQVGIWRHVSETVKDALAASIAEGIKDGESIREIRRRIQNTIAASKRQAERIARTETTASLNSGAHAVRESEGIETKVWFATLDLRTRTPPKSPFDHLGANGLEVKNSEPFNVSGEELRFPGDISLGASGGNVINCRCSASVAF